jgi:hypothetical protein
VGAGKATIGVIAAATRMNATQSLNSTMRNMREILTINVKFM